MGAVCLALFGIVSAIGVFGGGLLGILNFRVMVWFFSLLMSAGSGGGWVSLPLAAKSGALLAIVGLAGFMLEANIIALAAGYSAVVISVVFVGSAQYLRNNRLD